MVVKLSHCETVSTEAIPDKGLVVTVLATDRRNDTGLARPMVDEVVRRYGCAPRRLLLDEGYALRADVEGLAHHPAGAVSVYMPPSSETPDAELAADALSARAAKRAKEPQAVKDWRARMRTEDAAAIFSRRKLIERIHAHYKNRGLGQLTLRGLAKAQAAALWHALANNLMVAHRLRAQAA